MVTRHCIVKVRGVSTVFAALPTSLAEAPISKLCALETLAMSENSGPCFKGASLSDAGPGRKPA